MLRHLSLAVCVAALWVCAPTALAAPSPLLPFPDDRFTVPADTETGRRVALPSDRMPKNRLGVPMDVTDLNRADGFSPGTSIIASVPGLSVAKTDLPPIDDPKRSLRRSSAVQVLDARTGQRHLVWAELDANATSDADRTLVIRPAVNFREGRRYVVVLRDLRDAAGRLLGPAVAPTSDVRRVLRRGGVSTERLHRAWSFTVASAASTTGRMLSIRDRAFAELGDTNLADRRVAGSSPAVTLKPDLPDGLPSELRTLDGSEVYAEGPIERKVRGTVRVPCFLSTPGCVTGGQFVLGSDGLPTRIPGNTAVYDFSCNIPRRAGKLRPALYGHGLFGSQNEIDSGQLKAFAFEHGYMFCAVDWNGMSTKDVPNTITVLQDLSRFPTLADHVQQGMLGFLYLGRAMIHAEGLPALAPFRDRIDTRELFYDGNSQGGIYGGTLTAIAPDFERAVLGVPGMNYSTLLSRSVDFDGYAHGDFEGLQTPLGMYDAYANEGDRMVIFALIQMLWDRADPNGYAQHMTDDPLPNTPSHKVLMHVAFGDHQVADVSAEVQARTVGARLMTPVLARERYTGRPYPDRPSDPWFGLRPVPRGGYDGSAIVFWDTGLTPPPPAGNVPPREGKDPHSAPRSSPVARRQKSEFLRPGGRVVDVCDGRPCGA
jgi:hypothetical protein